MDKILKLLPQLLKYLPILKAWAEERGINIPDMSSITDNSDMSSITDNFQGSMDTLSAYSGASQGYDRVKGAIDNIQQPAWYSTYVYFNYMIILLSLGYVSYTLYLVWSRGIDDEQTQKVKRTGEIIISNLFLILMIITFLALASIVPAVIGLLKVIF